MAKHGSASALKETPHAPNTQDFTQPIPNQILSRSIRKRALRIINNQAVDPRTRNWIRYALGINDPITPSLVRRAEAGEIFDESFSLEANQNNGDRAVSDFSIEYDSTAEYSTVDESVHQPERHTNLKTSLQEVEEDQTIDEKLEALTDLICRPGNEPDIKSGALLLLMSTLENSSSSQSLATTTKYLAFMRCCELNLYGMVDAHTALVAQRLLAEK